MNPALVDLVSNYGLTQGQALEWWSRWTEQGTAFWAVDLELARMDTEAAQMAKDAARHRCLEKFVHDLVERHGAEKVIVRDWCEETSVTVSAIRKEPKL